MTETIGDRLDIAIKERGITKVALAEKVGVSANYVTMLVKNRYIPSDPLISKLCKELNIRSQWLTEGTGSMTKTSEDTKELVDLVEELLTWESDEFRSKLIASLIRLPLDDWTVIENFVDGLKSESTDK